MITILATIVVLSVLIFVHEFGHFIAAKISGVRVEKFSIGFPPTVVKKRIGDTIYAIGAIPFGGYVRLSGEHPDSEDAEPAPYDLPAKSVSVRAIIMAAGPVMNVILALGLFWFIIAFHGTGRISDSPVAGGIIPDSPADSAGLVENDIIVSVNGIPISNWDRMADIIHNAPGEEVTLKVERSDSVFALSIIPGTHEVSTDSGEITIGLIGVQPMVDFEPQGLFKAIPGTFILVGDIFVAIWSFIEKLFGPGLQQGDIGGPVLIAKIAGASAQSGWASFLFFMAALSINLAVLNLLPLPVLDGGHLLFLFIEAIRRKPVSTKVRMIAQQIGFLIIIALMVYVTVNDIFSLF